MVIIELPKHVKYIIETLEQNGYEAYAVGGCVRDSILGREPNDWDITTSADPYEVKKLFSHTIDTGLQHGTVTIMLEHVGYEVTTYRIDGDYEDSRHPKEVTFTKSLEEDLKRRDFTVNAMAYNDRDGLIDLFQGMDDIQKKVIRCVGNAEERFTEDALRIMRAVRFSAQFGYEIEPETRKAIVKLAPNLKNISAERIREELIKLLVSDHPDYIRIAYETGITAQILPELDVCMETKQNTPHHRYTVGEHIIHSLTYVPGDKVLRLAMLMHDIGKPYCITTDETGRDHFKGHAEKSAEMAAVIMHRLKFDNDTLNRVKRLAKYHDWAISLSPPVKKATVRSMISKIGEDLFPDLFTIGDADLLAQSDYFKVEKEEKQQLLKEMYREIIEQGDCLSIKNLAVSGNDLIEHGMKPGKELGQVLQKMLEDVLKHPSSNNKEYLLNHLNKYVERT